MSETVRELAETEADRRWPSANSGLYEGLKTGFVLGAEWASLSRNAFPVVAEFKDIHGAGYAIQQSPFGFRYVWQEPGEPDDESEWFATRAGAVNAARDDWNTAGQGDDWAEWSERLAAEADEASKEQR